MEGGEGCWGGKGDWGEVEGGEGDWGEVEGGEGDWGEVEGGEGDWGEVEGGEGDWGEGPYEPVSETRDARVTSKFTVARLYTNMVGLSKKCTCTCIVTIYK